MSNVAILVCFTVYTIFYEAIIWGCFGYAVFFKDYSSWWILVAILVSGCQLRPKTFRELCND